MILFQEELFQIILFLIKYFLIFHLFNCASLKIQYNYFPFFSILNLIIIIILLLYQSFKFALQPIIMDLHFKIVK